MVYKNRFVVSWGIILCLSVFAVWGSAAQRVSGNDRGNLIGFVYGNDGATPADGVKVMVRNVTTGTVYESGRTDAAGVFKFEGLSQGVYAVGVSSNDGSFNGADFIGVASGETAKVSIALRPFSSTEAAAAAVVARDQQAKGEAYIGRVTKYSHEKGQAEVFVERGLIQQGDRVRIKSDATNVVQSVKTLFFAGAKSDRIVAGNTATLPTIGACQTGDYVYLICKRGIPPFFVAPLGIAAIVAGSASLITIEEEEDISPFKVTEQPS